LIIEYLLYSAVWTISEIVSNLLYIILQIIFNLDRENRDTIFGEIVKNSKKYCYRRQILFLYLFCLFLCSENR